MKDTLFVIGKIIGLLVFILAFSLMGITSGRPVMILAYAGFLVVVMGIIFLFVRKNQRHFELISQGNRKISKIIGIIMVIIAVAIPIVTYQMPLFTRAAELTSFNGKLDTSIDQLNKAELNISGIETNELIKVTLVDSVKTNLPDSLLNKLNNFEDTITNLANYGDASQQSQNQLFDFTSKTSAPKYTRISEGTETLQKQIDVVQKSVDSLKTVLGIQPLNDLLIQAQHQALKKDIETLNSIISTTVPGDLKKAISGFTVMILLNCLLSILLWAALIAGGVFAVYLINKKGSSKINKILGYLIIVIIAAVPALLVIPQDKTTTGIGSVYYVAVLVAVLSWWGASLYLNKD